ncbi:BPTD_3080 family restriction endonuclease [Parvularcula sp. IMCC14364]|uniref:BPTD_3080 family restriction endonuclease n=1 Tax=Parvularcula sp. IMCC14364 TaxID=3067902 RepID=UPI0027419612|nr:DEAD/DEAH box helicase family protein [Parvularcula sp. IMCC14364]
MDDYDFFKHPILNNPYEEPTRHHDLDESGQPRNTAPIESRRKCADVTPVPKARRGRGADQQQDMLVEKLGNLDPTPIINEIRQHVTSWRNLPTSDQWGVTPATAKLLRHWREHKFASIRPFFCQREAVETVIWLTEVARTQKRYAHIWDHIKGGNEEANPELMRIAMKMATGAGKTTVMAMLMAWQTVNAVRSKSSRTYTDSFLIITPGITICDRLRVLQPNDPDSYYKTRELLPMDLLPDMGQAKIVITNYHAFQRREKTKLSKGTRGAIEGRREEKIDTLETEGKMLRRAVGDLMGKRGIMVINDEAHHCYRRREDSTDEDDLKGDDKKTAQENNKAAHLWISGIEAVKRKLGVRGVYDLSATPFFLSGSGYPEGTLFPWTVSDFSLMDAIECGIVKLPRVPVLDNMPTVDGKPVYRNLWEHIGKKLPKKGVGKSGGYNPADLNKITPLITAMESMYSHYVKVNDQWEAAGHEVPPVFIVVCNNTSTSRLIHDWIAGYEVPETDEAPATVVPGQLKMFSNYDEHRNRHPKPNTLIIDSAQFESGEGAIDKTFKDAMAPEIEQFRKEVGEREGAEAAKKISDEQLLREVMNTVGEKGKLGGSIRCVISVSMLTEGWDANTVTHILGVRAFGTQLLCEQVVGRGLRRKSYELNEHGLFDVEYADIMGIPFDFTAKPTIALPSAPKPVTRVRAVKDREKLAISFPRVDGYRTELPGQRITAKFTDDSVYPLTPERVGPTRTRMSGVVGQQETFSPDNHRDEFKRPSSIAYRIAKHLLMTKFPKEGQALNMNLFPQVKRIVLEWLDGGYLQCAGTEPHMATWPGIIDEVAEKIYMACQPENAGEASVSVILNAFNPRGDTRFVNFTTSKTCFATDPRKCHVSHVVEDSTWEGELARVAEDHPRVLAYVKNQGLGFEIPYRYGPETHKYIPDFIVRVNDGHGPDDPLNIIMEVKGLRDEKAVQKAETMKKLWVPGVNNHGGYGRWAFTEFRGVFEMEQEFAKLIDGYVTQTEPA